MTEYFKKKGKDILKLVGIVRDSLDDLERVIEGPTDSIKEERIPKYLNLRRCFNRGDFDKADFYSIVPHIRMGLHSLLWENYTLRGLNYVLARKFYEMSEIMIYAVEMNIDYEAMAEEEKNKQETANDSIASLYGMEKEKTLSVFYYKREIAREIGRLYYTLSNKAAEAQEIMLYAIGKDSDCKTMTREEKNKRKTTNNSIARLYGMKKVKTLSELKELAMMEVVYTVYRVWVNIDTHGLKKGLVKFYEEMEKRDSGAEKTFYKDLNLLLEDSEDELDEYVEEIAEDTEIMDESDDWMDDEECLRG